MSDNGSEGAAMEAKGALGDDLLRVAHTFFDNKLDNIGNHDSFVWYGPRWAQAATAPLKLYKGYSTEGGIRVPFVMRYPPLGPKGAMVRGFSTVMDLAPTILELAGVKHPVTPGQERGPYRGRQVYAMRGHSWVPTLNSSGFESDMEAFHGKDSFVGWELGGKAALRKGKWKITYLPSAWYGQDRFALYDMVADPGERVDLSSKFPEKYSELLSHWDEYTKQTGTIWPHQMMAGDPKRLLREGQTLSDTLGGDPIEQCTAWMTVGEGDVAHQTLPDLTRFVQEATNLTNGTSGIELTLTK